MADRKQYLKEYHHNQWKNNARYREVKIRRNQEFKEKFYKEHGISYSSHYWRKMKRELHALREQRIETDTSKNLDG